MKRTNNLRQHIISLRVSTDEWESLREAMQLLKVGRVSDLMREALSQVMVPRTLESPAAEGAREVA